MNLALLHIGMMKTATSYMQTVWLRQPEVALARLGSFTVMNALRDAISNGQMDPDANLDIKTDHEPKEGQKIVVSNEGFSTAFLNNGLNNQVKVGAYIDYAASMLGRLLPDLDNALVVVRDPVSWIRSIHLQSIKEGGFQGASEFVESQFNFLCHSLDLRLIVESYERSFPNMRVLTHELLKTDEDAFWSSIETWFGVPSPTISVERLNQSLGKSDSLLLARLNRLGGSLMAGLSNADSYLDENEKKMLIEGYGGTAVWVYRRFVEYASEADRNAVAKLVGLSEVDESFFDFTIPDVLKEKIENDFIGFLEERGMVEESVLGGYKSSLLGREHATRESV